MNKIVIMAFTSKGHGLANDLAEKLKNNSDYKIEAHRVSKLDELVRTVFKQGNILIFIGAVGIAIRGIAPYLQSKTTDPAVIVIDESGKFVIPILSGHIGGANPFAIKVADILNATPVITTATDVNKVFAVDSFALANGYSIANPERIKDISSALLDGKEVGLSTEFEIIGALPANIKLKNGGDVGIRIDCNLSKDFFAKTLFLIPKCYHVGIGTRKNTDIEKLEQFFIETLEENSIPIESVQTISSVVLKKYEPAICNLSEKYRIPFVAYSAEELLPYEGLFSVSEFVKQTTGVGNICETSAYLSSKKGKFVHAKTAQSGMTIAIAKEKWRIIFENTSGRN